MKRVISISIVLFWLAMVGLLVQRNIPSIYKERSKDLPPRPLSCMIVTK